MQRDDRLDSAKGVLIFLVVWTHVIMIGIRDSHLAFAVFSAVFLFHMPAFAMVCGLFARPGPIVGIWRSSLSRILLPLLLFHLLYATFLAVLQPDGWRLGVFPSAHLWFILSLLCWRLMLPVFSRLPGAAPLAIGLTLLAGYLPFIDGQFSLSRTLFFFPAFLVGYLWRDRIRRMALQRPAVPMAVLSLCAAFGVHFGMQGPGVFWFYGEDSYAAVGSGGLDALLNRAAVVLAGLAGALAFLMLPMPRSAVLAMLGRNSFAIYILHMFPVYLGNELLYGRLVPSGLYLLASPLVSVLMCLLLARAEQPLNRLLGGLSAHLGRLRAA